MQIDKQNGVMLEISNKGASLLLRNELREKIIVALKQNDGCTISDVSRLLDIHPSTASKYLAVMEAERSVIRKQIGMAKVFKMKSMIFQIGKGERK